MNHLQDYIRNYHPLQHSGMQPFPLLFLIFLKFAPGSLTSPWKADSTFPCFPAVTCPGSGRFRVKEVLKSQFWQLEELTHPWGSVCWRFWSGDLQSFLQTLLFLLLVWFISGLSSVKLCPWKLLAWKFLLDLPCGANFIPLPSDSSHSTPDHGTMAGLGGKGP